MKILHVIPSVAARYGGPSSAIVPMCRSLMAQGIETLVATTDADGETELDVPHGTPTVWEGIPAIFFRRQFSEAFKYSHGLGKWLERHVGDFSAVHIHAVLSYASLAAARACRLRGVPYVVRPLGTIDPWSLGQKALKKQILLAIAGRRMLKGAAAIHYTSMEEQRAAEQTLGLERGVIVPLGIDEAFLSEPLVPEEERAHAPYVLVLSRLHPVKNLEPLIAAFSSIVTTTPGAAHWRMIVAGTGEPAYTTVLREAADTGGASDRVSFVGWTGGEAKQQLTRHASLYALPSFHENFGVSLVESLAAGVPALVSHDVHLAETIETSGAGWTVATDEASIRAGLLEAMMSAAARGRTGLAARELARTFAWPSIAADLDRLYQQVAAGPSHATSPASPLAPATAHHRAPR